MAPIVFAGPYVPPPAPGSRWPGLTMTWTGWDGSVWTLTDDAGGVYLPNSGVRGLNPPKRTLLTSQAPGRPGARVRGGQTQPREVMWPIEIFSDAGSGGWLDLDAAFWRTLDEDRPGVWRVTRPGGAWRELDCQYVDDGDHTFDLDPSVVGWEVYQVSLIAYQPYWRGKPVTAGPWGESDQVPMYPGHITVSEGSTTGSARITNPGDVEVWPTWTLKDIESSATVVLDGHTIAFGAVDGVLTIDTENQVAMLNGVDVTGDLVADDFAPVQPSMTSDVEVTLIGGGTVGVELVPLYRRAW